MKMAMIGGRTSTVGFRALGVDTYTVLKPADAREVWAGMPPEEYAVVFVTEPIYRILKDDIEGAAGQPLPVVTVIPGVAGRTGWSEKDMKRLVEKAIGADIVTMERGGELAEGQPDQKENGWPRISRER